MKINFVLKSFLLLIIFVHIQVSSTEKIESIWDNLSHEVYIENLVACHVKIKELQWSHNLWPKENKTLKPPFINVINKEEIYKGVLSNLQMESELLTRFNLELSQSQLQNELNRMAQNTKDPKKLKQLFALLDNNPTNIVECVARPNLVKNILYKKYSYDYEVHKNLRLLAENELNNYRTINNLSKSMASENFIEYTIEIKNKQNKKEYNDSNDFENNYHRIELNEQEFFHKLRSIKPDLQEKDTVFVFQELISQSPNSFKVKNLVWNKQRFDEWIRSQPLLTTNKTSSSNRYILPAIKNNTYINTNSGIIGGDIWKRQGVPDGIGSNKAIWTGSEMIIWGGSNSPNSSNIGGRYNPITDSWYPMSNLDAPEGRYAHTAVWTGTEIIIFGGRNSFGTFNTGGRYNPINDSWLEINSENVPAARDRHTAVWTGAEMIIWGGADGPFNSDLNTGGKYNPITDTWSTTNMSGAPVKRSGHTAIWTGSEMLIWGVEPVPGGRYNPLTNSWIDISTINAPLTRRKHTAIWTGSEMIIWGGSRSGRLNTGSKYNPSNNIWTEIDITDAPEARASHTAIWTGTEMVVWGGDNHPIILNTGGRYNPVTDSWVATSIENVPRERTGHVAVWTGNEMLVWGGVDNKGARYNPNTDMWIPSQLSSVESPRKNHTAIWTGSEMIVWGGTDDYNINLNTGDRYVPATDTWSPISIIGAPTPRTNHSSVWTGLEMITWGGFDGEYTNTGGHYNPLTESWAMTGIENVPDARGDHTVIWTGVEMIIWGGGTSAGYNTGGRYNPITRVWMEVNTNNAPSKRVNHSAVWTEQEMIVWGGGYFGELNTGGMYDPSNDTWVETSLINAPIRRVNFSAIWSGSEMITWGGYNNIDGYLNSGGRYDPATDSWLLTNEIIAPTNRSSHSAIWTGSEMIIWGGYCRDASQQYCSSTGSNLSTGSVYDPKGDIWHPTSMEDAPKGRNNHTAIWTGNEMLIWGGEGASSGVGVIYSIGIYYPANGIIFQNGFE